LNGCEINGVVIQYSLRQRDMVYCVDSFVINKKSVQKFRFKLPVNLFSYAFRGSNVPLCENRPNLPRTLFDGDRKVPQKPSTAHWPKHVSSFGETTKLPVMDARQSNSLPALTRCHVESRESIRRNEINITTEGAN
jgi:hypothetical protein